jgi:myo-inositol 2-dehydrogenase / D-chiro-inositol 1-dehydrogenase
MQSRRQVLIGAAASAIAAPAEREIRTAMIGVGVRGGSLLTQALKQPGVRISAICDTDPQARDRALSAAGRDNPRSFTEYRQILDLKNVEAVFIATPCDLHAEMSAACLDAGKYVYCEKPLGITPEQVELALQAQKRANTFLQIGQQLRYLPVNREVIRQIHQEKLLGELFVIRAQRDSVPVPREAEEKRPAWYKDVRRSGDLIVENAVHNIDLCNWVANSRPVSAFGHGKKYFPKPVAAGKIIMDGFSVEYIYENDIHLDYSQLYLHPRTLKELPNGQFTLVFGEKGVADVMKGVFYDINGTDPPRPLVNEEQRKSPENAMADFYACIRENRKPYADVRVGAVAALTAIMGREAIYRRRMVTWNELGVSV